MKKPTRALLLLVVLLAPTVAGGCGTVVSLFNEPGPYSGVKCTADHFEEIVVGSGPGPLNFDFSGVNDPKAALFLLGLFLTRPIWTAALVGVDLILSAVADTLLLPFTLTCRGGRPR